MAKAAKSDQGFGSAQVCTVAGITHRQLDYWARTGLLTPSITEAKGSGTQRRYSYADVLELKVIKQLLDAGISLIQARLALGCLRKNSQKDVVSANLVINGTSSIFATREEIVDVLENGQGVLNIVPMTRVVSELEAAIESLWK